MCIVSSFSCQHYLKGRWRRRELGAGGLGGRGWAGGGGRSGMLYFYFPSFEGSCLFVHGAVDFSQLHLIVFFPLSFSIRDRARGEKRRSCSASGLGAGPENIYNRHIAPCSASQASVPPPLRHPPATRSPSFTPPTPHPSLPPSPPLRSSSIDAGSHTCHLSLLIMHGRCC